MKSHQNETASKYGSIAWADGGECGAERGAERAVAFAVLEEGADVARLLVRPDGPGWTDSLAERPYHGNLFNS